MFEGLDIALLEKNGYKSFRILIPLRVQLGITYLLLFSVTFVFFSIYLLKDIRTKLDHTTEENLIRYGYLISHFFSKSMEHHLLTLEQRKLIDSEMEHLSHQTDAWIGIINHDGTVLENTGGWRKRWIGNRPEIQKALGGQPASLFRKRKGINTVFVAVPIFAGIKTAGAVYLFKPLTANQEFLGSVRDSLMKSGILVFISAFLLIYLFSYVLTRPLQKITSAIHGMQTGKLDLPLKVLPHNEIGTLGITIKEMADTIQSHAEKLSFVLSKMANGVLVLKADAAVEYINDQAQKLIHLNPGEKLPDNSPFFSFFQNILKKESPPVFEYEVPDKKTIQVIATPILQEKNLSGLIAVFQDVSEYKRIEKLRAQFVSDVSHELKTPLSSIKALCEILRDSALQEPEQAKKFLSQMEQEVDRLSRLVKDLLNLSKLESEAFPLNKQEAILEEVIQEAASQFQNFENRISISHGKTIVTLDVDRIKQVLCNLFDNAIKACGQTKNPEIKVKIKTWTNKILVSVADNGIGIPSQDIPRIFERFYRVNQARTRKDGGTGLGLAIVKQIIQQHGGEIWVESSPKTGTVFFFTLPLF
jgi:signal transduction histidine kinase